MKLIFIHLKYQTTQLLRVEKSREGRERLFEQTRERGHHSPNIGYDNNRLGLTL